MIKNFSGYVARALGPIGKHTDTPVTYFWTNNALALRSKIEEPKGLASSC